ncbi:hypothetical protein Tco_0782969 [Tanacetum coccineum]
MNQTSRTKLNNDQNLTIPRQRRQKLDVEVVKTSQEALQSPRQNTSRQIKVLPPRTAEEIVARERERKARTTLLMALPEDHLAKFHKMTDAKEMWDAIKLDMVDNDESLPSAWSQVSLIMRTKPGVDTLSFDDLYNNLRVFESDIKGSTASSSSSSQNVAFVLDTQTLSSMDHVGFEQSDDMTLKINGLEMASACLNENEKVLQKNAQTQTQRFVTSDGMHAVPPPMTGNYMPSGPNVEIDDSKFTYGPKLPITSESETNTSDFSSSVLTRTGRIPVNTARPSSTNKVSTARQNSSQAVLTSAARKVNTCFNIVALELSKEANSLQAEEQDIPLPTITAMKIPIIRKGEYDIWSMRMPQYICHTDHNLWDVIVNGDLEEEPAPTTGETSAPPAPKTAKQLAAIRNQERVKSILLLEIPDEYLLNLDKAYDRFQKLISQLEVHGAPISKEDINQKFLRSLPSSWNQIALIMRNKHDIDKIDIDDLYNNLRVYEDELKRSSGFNSAYQNLAFLSSENIGSTNEVSTASGDFGVSTAGGINQVPSTPCAHDIAYSFLA